MIRIIVFTVLVGVMASCQKATKEEIDAFCRDLNILLIQKNVLRSNILNINTTRTAEGGPYVPKMVSKCGDGGCDIVPLACVGVGCDPSITKRDPILKYEPGHPDANPNGYVAYPFINLDEEKVKLDKVNVAIQFLFKSMPVKHGFFFSKEAEKYYKKYPMLDGQMNFRKLIEDGK